MNAKYLKQFERTPCQNLLCIIILIPSVPTGFSLCILGHPRMPSVEQVNLELREPVPLLPEFWG